MRSTSKSWLIAVLFGAIIFVFIFSFGQGSSGFRTRTNESWAAKVNGAQVNAADFDNEYANRFRQMSEQRGNKYTIENAKQDGLKKEVLKSLVDRELIAQQGPKLGIVVSDEELATAIQRSPQFQQDGKFDKDYYARVVENYYGMSLARFEALLRKDLLRQKVIEALFAGATATDDEVQAHYIAQNEGAAISYVKFTAFMFRDKAQATEAEATEWAKSHEKEIADQYEKDKKTRWTQGAGVKVRAITVNPGQNPTPEAEAAAKTRIEALLAEVKGGKDFAAVAKEKSEDSVTKTSGGDLGFITKGGSAYGKTLEEEALKLKAGELSGVFKDRTGFHFLKAEELRAEKQQSLDEVRKQIAQDLLKGQKAKELAHEKAVQALADLRAGKELKDLFPAKAPSAPGSFDFSSFMTPQSSDTESFHPMGGYVPGVGLAPKLSAAAFALNAAGDLPKEPVEDGDTWYVFKLKSRTRADLSKLDDATKKSTREQVEQQKQRELYTSWIDKLRKDAKIDENESMLSYETVGQHAGFNPIDD
ncbi:MAG: SurA N-terminal domain-containing protein [Deltaproteobacteria bacterium]|nr:SurA N-terminal domain-containing protein [Deltaproteobacteria bacterium]